MVFPFSFNLSVPGINNPFTVAAVEADRAANAGQAPFIKARIDDALPSAFPVHSHRPPSPSFPAPLCRKRGWVPSYSEPSPPASVYTSTSGFLDTPAKYQRMAQESANQEIEELVADIPPPKRRRTLAGSIISTALSAALIGTAVGLTVYRLWKDRGKNPEPLPPPPYEQGEWVPPEPETPNRPTAPSFKPVATPRSRKSRPIAGRRTVPRQRKTPSRSGLHHYGQSSYVNSRSPIPPEFSFTSGSRSSPRPADDADVDDQMSWMGDRLAQLIAEGQKALGKEVVVMSEDQADEVDDGSGAWVEEDDEANAASSRSYGIDATNSPGRSSFCLNPSPTRSRFGRGISVESDARSVRSEFREDESSWTTAEMRESMERARMLYKQKRGL